MEKQTQIWIIKQKLTKTLNKKNTHYTNWCVAGYGGRRRVVRSVARWCELKRCDRRRWRQQRVEASPLVPMASWSIAIGTDRQQRRLSVAIGTDRQRRCLKVAMAPTAARQARSAVTAKIRWSGCEVLSEGKRESGKGRKIK